MIVTCARLPPSSKSKTRFRNLSSRPLCRQLAPPIPCSRNSIYISLSIRQRPLHPCSSLVNGYFPPRPLFIKARKERSVGEEIVKRVTIEDDPSFARRRKRRRSRCSGVDGHGSTVAARVRQAETDIDAQTSPAECLLPETRLWDFPDGIRSFRGIDATIERVFDVGTRVTYDSLVNLLLFRERERLYPSRSCSSSFESLGWSTGVEACATRSRTERTEKKDCFYLLDIFFLTALSSSFSNL